MSTPPIAKEPEVTGLDEARERLEAIKVATEPATQLPLMAGRRIVHDLAREALALMESEQGEQMRRDHEAMEKLRELAQIGYATPSGLNLWSFDPGQIQLIGGRGSYGDPTDAILGTESENGEDDE